MPDWGSLPQLGTWGPQGYKEDRADLRTWWTPKTALNSGNCRTVRPPHLLETALQRVDVAKAGPEREIQDRPLGGTKGLDGQDYHKRSWTVAEPPSATTHEGGGPHADTLGHQGHSVHLGHSAGAEAQADMGETQGCLGGREGP